jgi:hypothetical protein
MENWWDGEGGIGFESRVTRVAVANASGSAKIGSHYAQLPRLPALVACAVRGRVTGHPRRSDQTLQSEQAAFCGLGLDILYDTVPGFSLGTASGDALRLSPRPLNGGVFRDFWDAGVTKHSHHIVSWVSYGYTLHYILRDTSVSGLSVRYRQWR